MESIIYGMKSKTWRHGHFFHGHCQFAGQQRKEKPSLYLSFTSTCLWTFDIYLIAIWDYLF